ncbi:MAG: DUF1501 domain-containing protein [Gemmataceae bacterium]
MLHRRDAMMRLGELGLGALSLPGLLGAEQARRPSGAGKAKSCIFLFLWGGPPQQDLWDLKPDAPQGVRSLFHPIRTSVPGIQVCDQMPLLAKHADKVAFVRSVTHDNDVHDASCHRMLTGRRLASQRAFPGNNRTRTDYPCPGSVVAHFSPAGAVPATVTVPRPLGHDGVTYAGTHGGFLGSRCDPMELKGPPAYNGFAELANVERPATHSLDLPPGVDERRLLGRQGLLRRVEARDRQLQAARDDRGLGGLREQAFRMIASPAARRAFDVGREPLRVRERYGLNEYGESFLMARRLVEAGVRLVTVNWMYVFPDGKVINVWDNHSGFGVHGARTGYDLLKGPACIPPLDRAYTALLDDLGQRGLLDETLVVAVGEFGRTPKINADAGRDHWGKCQTALLAGGGVRGGQIHGATDAQAAYVKDAPVSPEDLLATVYHAMGLPPESEVRDREDRPHRISDGRPVTALFG